MNCKPYIDILNKRGYFIVEEDEELVISKKENSYYYYYPTYSKQEARVSLDLTFIGNEDVASKLSKQSIGSRNFEYFELEKIYAYHDHEEDNENTNGLMYCKTGNNLVSISRITPELFSVILDIMESKESELNHSHKIIQRYLDAYNNIIKPIVNPVIKLKKLNFISTLVIDGFNQSIGDSDIHNRCIELQYFNDDDYFEFAIGVDYLTGKLFYYQDLTNVLFNFENLITTKGRFKELLEREI